MALIPDDKIEARFEQLASEADRVDVAVAWVRPCDAVQVLIESGTPVRIIAGISINSTDPSSLKNLAEQDHVNLRIVPNGPKIFHPKYFCFHGKKTVCWIGSSNLTRGGFGRNTELVHEFVISRSEDECWFEMQWQKLAADPGPQLREYESSYVPPKTNLRTISQKDVRESDLPHLDQVESWEDFVEGIRTYDEWWCNQYGFGVIGETHSWFHTLDCSKQLVRFKNWNELSKREYQILRGSNSEEGSWALLGGG